MKVQQCVHKYIGTCKHIVCFVNLDLNNKLFSLLIDCFLPWRSIERRFVYINGSFLITSIEFWMVSNDKKEFSKYQMA
jgi:hypothetical protein